MMGHRPMLTFPALYCWLPHKGVDLDACCTPDGFDYGRYIPPRLRIVVQRGATRLLLY